nr:reverse transcriptase domain-containing protein [Tanacetum cinerariifolium]
NTIPNSKGEIKAITTRSGIAYEEPSIPTPKKVVERETEETTDKEQTNFQESTTHIQPLVVLILEPNVLKTLPKPNIPYPSRLNDQKLREKATNQMEKFFQDKLFELAKIPLNENCSAMLLKKLPEKLGDPEKFLIPCDFSRMDVCHALADLGASINLMPLSILKKLSLPELTPTRMTLELADQSITCPKGVVKVVFIKVGKFHFSTDFVVVYFEVDPRVSLILGGSFLRTSRALIDVYREEITLRINDEAVTFNLNETTRYSSTYDDILVNRIDVIDVARVEYAQEILGFSNNSSGCNSTSTSKPIIFYSSPSLTPFVGSDFILEEIEAYLKDESISPEIDHADCDPEGDICLIEKLLNDDPFQLLSMDLKQGEVVKEKSLIEEPPELELKDLPSHLEYAYLEGIDFMGPFPSSRENMYILVAVDYLSKWVEAKALPTNDARVVVKFLKSLFARFETLRAIISDRKTHFCIDKFAKVMFKYVVTHRLATAYHPQTSGQVEVSNRGLKHILERTVGENRASWSKKLEDALWAFRTAYKTPIGCTPYNDHRKLQLNELNELRDQAYENSLIYKEKTKKLHDSKIKNRIFNVGDRVLLFNSRLKIFSRKLKIRWSGPFTITKVFPYRTIELSQPEGLNFKVNGHCVKHYFGGDVP